MEATAPPRLSGLAEELLLRRPPSLRELATLVAAPTTTAGSRGWCAVSFPPRRRRCCQPPTWERGWRAGPELFGERHFPLHAGYLEYYLSEDDEPPCTVLRRGIPYGLLGFGYEGLHEMWDGYRDGISAMALLAKPPDTYIETDGIRVAWLESAAARIPQDTLLRIPEGGIPLDVLKETLKGTRFEGAAGAGAWSGLRPAGFSSTYSYEDGFYDGFADAWEDEIIAEATREWAEANAILDSVDRLVDWLEEDLPGRFAEMVDFVLARLPNQHAEEEET